jgi:hypothetical protein
MTATETTGGDAGRKAPVHFWIVAILSLLWNAFGAFDYLATQLELDFYMGAFNEEQLAYFYGFPAWSVAAWAFGVWGAVAGSIGLLLRKKWAVWAFAVSIAGMVVNGIYTFFLTKGLEIMGEGAPIITVVIWVVAIFLLIYAIAMKKRGILN